MANAIITALILIIGLKALSMLFPRPVSVSEWLSDLSLRIGASAVGSFVSVYLRPSKGGSFRLFMQWFIGLWFGYVGCDPFMNFMGWEQTHSYILFSASALSVVGQSITQFLTSPELLTTVKGAIKSRIEKAG